MESLQADRTRPTKTERPLPGWTVSRAAAEIEADAALAAGVALKALDDIVRSDPAWGGCWRARQALRCATQAIRLLGREEDAAALRDAILLAAPGDDPGPGGRVYLAYKSLTSRRPAVKSSSLAELAERLSVRWDDKAAKTLDLYDEAVQSGRSAPFAAASLVSAICAERPDAEVLAWWLADRAIAEILGWDRPVPLLMAERYGTAFRIFGGRGRVRPGDEAFPRSVCLALAAGAAEAIGLANDVARRAERFSAITPKVRTKGAATVFRQILDDDAVSAAAPGSGLSRWASRRLFDRLETLGAVRELSGRANFRTYGL